MDYNVHRNWTRGGENVDKETINIAKRVKDARKSVKLTQAECGEIIGKSKQWVSELERGNIKLTFEMAVKISIACNKTIDFFVTKKYKT